MGQGQFEDAAALARRVEPLELSGLADGALVLVDSAPIIYLLENHPKFALRFRPLFARHEAEEIQLAVTTISIAECWQDHCLAATKC